MHLRRSHEGQERIDLPRTRSEVTWWDPSQQSDQRMRSLAAESVSDGERAAREFWGKQVQDDADDDA